MLAARLTFVTPVARLAFISPRPFVPSISRQSAHIKHIVNNPRYTTGIFQRHGIIACDRGPSVSQTAKPVQEETQNQDKVPGNGASRTLVGRVLVEALSLIVGALLLLVVVAWRASQVVYTSAWRALLWLSNLRRLGKWAFARAAQAKLPAVEALRDTGSRLLAFFIRSPQATEKIIKESTAPTRNVQGVDQEIEIEGMRDMVSAEVRAETEERRRLILVRHAKTEWDRGNNVADHERVLSGKGKEEAMVTGTALISRGWIPHAVLCSDAARTVQTLSLLNIPEREGQRDTLCTKGLYYAVTGEEMAVAVDEMLGEVGFNDRTTLMVVCHNPGCEELVEQLTSHRVDMGTGCAALLEFEGKEEMKEGEVFRLAQQNQSGWRLVDVLRPSVLASARRAS